MHLGHRTKPYHLTTNTTPASCAGDTKHNSKLLPRRDRSVYKTALTARPKIPGCLLIPRNPRPSKPRASARTTTPGSKTIDAGSFGGITQSASAFHVRNESVRAAGDGAGSERLLPPHAPSNKRSIQTPQTLGGEYARQPQSQTSPSANPFRDPDRVPSRAPAAAVARCRLPTHPSRQSTSMNPLWPGCCSRNSPTCSSR